MEDIRADLPKQLLTKLMFVTGCKYSELEKVTDNHDLFNYHLKELQHKGLVVKNGTLYQLTEKGRQAVALMEEDGELQRQIKVGLFIDLVRKENGKDQMLLHKRLKHPHYGYSGAVTGKLKWGQTLEENLRRELMEELQVTPVHFKLIGSVRELFRNEDQDIVGDGVYFVYIVDEWVGEISYQSIEGEYYWHDIDRILELDKIFRTGFEKGLPYLNHYLAHPDQPGQYVFENGSEGLKY
jgi:ADP-ribose pyrophosphatase YjhB (NUDIX family)